MTTAKADGKHECPVDGCARRVPFHTLMCHNHWSMVPRDLGRRVLRLWSDERGQQYFAAREEAIGAVNAQLGREATQ